MYRLVVYPEAQEQIAAIQGQRRESPTVSEIEEIARRVAREEIAGR